MERRGCTATYLTLVLFPSHLRVYFVSDGKAGRSCLERIQTFSGILMWKVSIELEIEGQSRESPRLSGGLKGRIIVTAYAPK